MYSARIVISGLFQRALGWHTVLWVFLCTQIEPHTQITMVYAVVHLVPAMHKSLEAENNLEKASCE